MWALMPFRNKNIYINEKKNIKQKNVRKVKNNDIQSDR